MFVLHLLFFNGSAVSKRIVSQHKKIGRDGPTNYSRPTREVPARLLGCRGKHTERIP
jgi:hypothetical protein